uniref:Uncharacterized protein n=1 Tax=Romanomermis culicivorax TaxID=13658 RepID=A0A915L166_ROMCU
MTNKTIKINASKATRMYSQVIFLVTPQPSMDAALTAFVDASVVILIGFIDASVAVIVSALFSE